MSFIKGFIVLVFVSLLYIVSVAVVIVVNVKYYPGECKCIDNETICLKNGQNYSMDGCKKFNQVSLVGNSLMHIFAREPLFIVLIIFSPMLTVVCPCVILCYRHSKDTRS